MTHLTVDEIIEFVSMDEFSADALEFSQLVNGHIRQCDECLESVRSFQLIYDSFKRMGTAADGTERMRSEIADAEQLSLSL